MSGIAYFAKYDDDGAAFALFRFVNHARIDYLRKTHGTWQPSDKCVEQLYDATIDKVGANEARRIAQAFGLRL